MHRLDWRFDHYTFPLVLKACGELSSFRRGVSVHAVAFVNGFDCNVFVCNSVVTMYGRCGALDEAQKMFDEMSNRGSSDIISWNSIMAAYAQNGYQARALELFEKMTGDVVFKPDAVSLVNVLPACGSTRAWLRGKQVHGYAIRSGLVEDVFVGNAVVDMYAKCELMEEANRVFERMIIKDVVSWNSMVSGYSQIGNLYQALILFEKMREENIKLDVVTWSAVIAGYAQKGCGCEALDIFRRMLVSGSKPNFVTLASLLSGCASIGALIHGKEIHCYAIKCVLNFKESGAGDDLMVQNCLIDMYAKCKNTQISRVMFDSIPLRDRSVATWTVMIGGYAQHGKANDALKLFSQMLLQKTNLEAAPNGFTISCALVACVHLASLRLGKQIHTYVLRNRFESVMLFVSNCLIDMYSKAGDIGAAETVFDNMTHKNTVSWTSLLTGYGMHGRGEQALKTLNEMRRANLVLDGVTFVGILYACSHCGLVDEGIKYFDTMKSEFGVVPGPEHFACMVDLLGRASRLGQAMDLIQSMPMKPTEVVWVALLSACRLHSNVEIGEYAANQLVELQSDNDGSYTLLSNIYANAKQWKDVAKVRTLMKKTGIRKRPGCSWVEGKTGTSTFFVGDRTHPLSQQIFDVLADLIGRIRAIGYIPDTRFALHDVDDEEKSDLLFEHSERLALAYGILITSPGLPIRITKNLRVCGDCHVAITFISKIIENEVILRDSSRFHHFKNGSCSCKGYW